MGWFGDLCRNVGLMIHNVRNPDGSRTRVVRHEVEEETRGKTILRRTTIEEVEFRPGDDPTGRQRGDDDG